jgi:hypothetical protein
VPRGQLDGSLRPYFRLSRPGYIVFIFSFVLFFIFIFREERRFIIQFNSIIYYLCAESTATRPITDTAQRRYNNNNNSQTIF